jgi:hypothetical protein
VVSKKSVIFVSLTKTTKQMKTIERFERTMDKVSMPIVILCGVFLIGRVLMSFVFGI